jgi:hypothetical protein
LSPVLLQLSGSVRTLSGGSEFRPFQYAITLKDRWAQPSRA